MKTSNPVLSSKAFDNLTFTGDAQVMTVQGTVNKTLLLLFLLFISASWIWGRALVSGGFIWLGLIGGFITALATVFKKEWAPVTSPLYAVCEGLALGGISAFMEMQYPGIVTQAVALTFGTLFCLLLAYKANLIRATEKFKSGIFAATGGICLVYIISWLLGLFGFGIPLIHSSGLLGIGFSLFVVGIAALNLVIDFDFIEQASANNLPKYMEWYGAFALIVTLVWLYIEILRLLSKLRRR